MHWGALGAALGALATLALLTAACGAGPQASIEVERTDSAGVEIVMNRGGDMPLEWGFEPVLRIGGEDEGPEAFFNIWRGSIQADDEGSLYVYDTGNHRVVVFDGEGEHLRTLGRQGGGPGEIMRAGGGFVLEDDGTVNVYDFGKRGLVRFDAEGEPLEERRIEPLLSGGVFALRDSAVLVQLDQYDEDLRGGTDVLARLEPSGDSTAIVSYPMPPMRPLESSCVTIGGMPKLFAPSLIWEAGASRLAVNAGAEYVIDVFEDTRAVASIRRDLAPRQATRSLARKEVGEEGMRVMFGGGGECVIPADELVEKQGVADVIPAIREFAIAPDGALWVRRQVVKGEDAPIDIIAPDGEYRGTLPPGSPLPAAFLPDGQIAALETDELDVPYVVVYRIVE